MKKLNIYFLCFLFLIPLSASGQKKNDGPEINQKNCMAVRAMGPTGLEALASQYRKSVYDFSFIRTEWDPTSMVPEFQCKVVINTPTGPIRCNTDSLYMNSKGIMYVFIEHPLSKATTCR